MTVEDMSACFSDIVSTYTMKLATSPAEVENVTGLDKQQREILQETIDELAPSIGDLCMHWCDEHKPGVDKTIEYAEFWGLLNSWYDMINAKVTIAPGNLQSSVTHSGG